MIFISQSLMTFANISFPFYTFSSMSDISYVENNRNNIDLQFVEPIHIVSVIEK